MEEEEPAEMAKRDDSPEIGRRSKSPEFITKRRITLRTTNARIIENKIEVDEAYRQGEVVPLGGRSSKRKAVQNIVVFEKTSKDLYTFDDGDDDEFVPPDKVTKRGRGGTARRSRGTTRGKGGERGKNKSEEKPKKVMPKVVPKGHRVLYDSKEWDDDLEEDAENEKVVHFVYFFYFSG